MGTPPPIYHRRSTRLGPVPRTHGLRGKLLLVGSDLPPPPARIKYSPGPYQGLLPDAIVKGDFGKAGAFYGLGNLVGSLVGFIVVGVFVSHGRYDLALFSMAAVLLVSMALTVTLIPDRAKPAMTSGAAWQR